MSEPLSVVTIGYSTMAVADFVDVLSQYEVAVVADVRSWPWSRWNPAFTGTRLAPALAAAGIGYAYLGAGFGARPDDPAMYDGVQVSFDRVAQSAAFREAVARVQELSSAGAVALMCVERDPIDCHRSVLVGSSLHARGWNVSHVRNDGSCETQENLMARLLVTHQLDGDDLFTTASDRARWALERQERRIAYTRTR